MDKRYPSDMTQREWAVLEPLLPRAEDDGRPRMYPLREIVNGIFYVLRSGCSWRMLPKDFPPWPTVYHYYRCWRIAGVWEQIHTALRERVRDQAHREKTPSAAILDSQSVRTSTKGGRAAMTGARK